jgi:hypothetical protein
LLVAASFATVGCGGSDVNKEPQFPSTDAPVGFDGPSTSVAASDETGIQQPLPAGEMGPEGRRLPPGVDGAGPGGGGGAGDGEGQMALGPDGEQLGPDGQPLPPDQYGDTDPSALTDFRETLSPYGQWVDDATYGTIWVPSSTVVGSDFTPYETAGQWGYDNGAYTWMSDYSWGWAPFHYGRWAYTGGYGWGWIPGRTYSGAWVSWRTGGPGYGYVGWAPMGPTWGWRNGAAVGFGFASRAPYAFCPTERLFSPGVANSVVRGPQVAGIASSTRPYTASAPSAHTVAHPTVNAGPSPSSLGISAQAVAHPSANAAASAQLARAQAFSRPSTAVAAGAHAPTINGAARVASSYRTSTYGRVGTSAYSSAHSPVATSQQYRGVSPTPYRSVGSSYARTSGVTRIGGGSSYGYGGASYNSMYSGGRSSFSTPSYHTPFVAHGTGTTAPTTAYPTGYNAPSVGHASSGGFHSGGFSRGGGGGGGGHGHR